MDGCLIQANASNNSVINKESLTRYLNKSYQTLESRLDQEHDESSDDDGPKPGAANQKHISTTVWMTNARSLPPLRSTRAPGNPA
jgi:hypothetical protein